MKSFFVILFLIILHFIAIGQNSSETVFLTPKSKASFRYVELNNTGGRIYQMGRYLDKAGVGYSIRNSDTLNRKGEDRYVGKNTDLIKENSTFYLLTSRKNKPLKILLDTVANLTEAYTILNNAYYLDHFMLMCRELNKTYPLNDYSFRIGFRKWDALPGKSLDPVQFRPFADAKLKEIKDSVVLVQNRLVAITNNLISRIRTIEYSSLKDSLGLLPAIYGLESQYFQTVVNEVSKQRPEYFFRLAEDFPDSRNIFFSYAENNKQVMANLKAVENHDKIKKDFFKERRFRQNFPYKSIGTVLVGIGLMVYIGITLL